MICRNLSCVLGRKLNDKFDYKAFINRSVETCKGVFITHQYPNLRSSSQAAVPLKDNTCKLEGR